MHNLLRVKILLLVLPTLLSGCLSKLPPVTESAPSPGRQLLATIDRAISDAGVRDAATRAVAGQPWLRIDRLQQTLLPLATGKDRRQAWLSRAHRLAAETRQREIRNLPEPALRQLLVSIDSAENRRQLQTRANDAALELLATHRDDPDLWQQLASNAVVPDSYRSWMRWFGYPLLMLPVKLLGDAAFNDFIDWHARSDAQLAATKNLTLYQAAPPERRRDLSLLARDPQGLLAPSPGELAQLARQYAPRLLQATSSHADQLGALQWQDTQLEVATDLPTGYYHLSHALIGKRLFPQINYVFWYPARSGANAPWIEHGRFDGLTIRITLSDSGQIMMTDIMNNCGCYHFFLPTAATLTDPHRAIGIDPLTPRLLPAPASEHLPALHIMSGWHQVEHLYQQPPRNPARSISYHLLPYQELESLPRKDGSYRSAFDSNGILTGSERIEPYLLFAMGIPEVGAMRQRGNHPITLIGREHFDNPRLFERFFTFKPRLFIRESDDQ